MTVLRLQEILRQAELYSPFTSTEEDVMSNELVGGLMSNVSTENWCLTLHGGTMEQLSE